MLDVRGDLLLEAGEALGVVDQGLGACRVELVDVDVEADRGLVAVELERAERGDVDLRAAGQGRAQGHRGVHGPDRDPDVSHDQQTEPGAQKDDGDQTEGAGPGVRLVDELDGRMGAPPAVLAGEGSRGPS
ncbi:hypothetical protein RKD19_004359 [Streptomyces canus]